MNYQIVQSSSKVNSSFVICDISTMCHTEKQNLYSIAFGMDSVSLICCKKKKTMMLSFFYFLVYSIVPEFDYVAQLKCTNKKWNVMRCKITFKYI